MLAHLLLLNLTIAPLWPGTLYSHYCRQRFSGEAILSEGQFQPPP
ncbi:hypothetical protein [Parathermosynechococcus lividus]